MPAQAPRSPPGWGSVRSGSDIAGSVRLPAGQCGLAALKPTQGLIPHLAPDIMRSAGPMGRSVTDIAAMLTVLAEPDGRDCWSLPPSPVAYEDHLERDVKGLKIGLLLDMGFDPRPAPEVVDVVRHGGPGAGKVPGPMVSEVPAPFEHDAYTRHRPGAADQGLCRDPGLSGGPARMR